MRTFAVITVLSLLTSALPVAQRVNSVQSASLARGTFHYKGELGPPSKAAPVTSTLLIRDGLSGVFVTETIHLPGNRTASEDMVLDPETLAVRKRLIRFDERTIDLTFSGQVARGTMETKGERSSMEFSLGVELFGDGGGAFAVLGALPLTPGSSHTFHNLDVANRTATRHHAVVSSVESITVEAGAFRAFHITLTADAPASLNMTHVWIDTLSRSLLRVESDISRYELVGRER